MKGQPRARSPRLSLQDHSRRRAPRYRSRRRRCSEDAAWQFRLLVADRKALGCLSQGSTERVDYGHTTCCHTRRRALEDVRICHSRLSERAERWINRRQPRKSPSWTFFGAFVAARTRGKKKCCVTGHPAPAHRPAGAMSRTWSAWRMGYIRGRVALHIVGVRHDLQAEGHPRLVIPAAQNMEGCRSGQASKTKSKQDLILLTKMLHTFQMCGRWQGQLCLSR